jgi:hypothetical protein
LLLKGRKNALTMLPETEPLRRKAEVAVQVFKDFQFQINDGFEAEARKTVNMVQEWQTLTSTTSPPSASSRGLQKPASRP